jgi:acyl-CoA thioesterase-2
MLIESGRSWPGFSARTLEHSMWFHRPVDPADWLLLDMKPTSLSDQRYLAAGTIHNEAGALAATVVQAGIFLPNPAV